MTDEAAPETRDDQPQAPGAEIVQRTPVENWLSQRGVEIQHLPDGKRQLRFHPAIAQQANLLTPMSMVVQLNRNWTPVPRLVQLVAGEDTYKQGYNSDAKDEEHALRATGLRKIADLMRVEHVATDWGRPPDGRAGVAARVTVRWRGPDGNYSYTTKTKIVVYEDHDEKLEIDSREKWETYNKTAWESAKAKKEADPSCELPKKEFAVWKTYGPGGFNDRFVRKLVLEDREHLASKVETKAWARCIREVAKVKTFLKRDLQKPFLTLTWEMTLDHDDPHSAAFVELQYKIGADALFGGGAAAAAAIGELSAGDVVDAGPELPPMGTSFVAEGHFVDDDDDDDRVLEGTASEIDDEQSQQILEAHGFSPEGAQKLREQAGQGDGAPLSDATATAIDDDWGDDEPATAPASAAFPKPEQHLTLPKGEFEGKDIEEVVATPAGRAYLAGKAAKLRAENQALVLAWLSWSADEDITLENALRVFGGTS